jgi:HNH endonuclease
MYIFVIDGGHRLSALRAWMVDDYGDGPISLAFYGGDISEEQKRIAKRTRKLIETTVGRYSKLRDQVDATPAIRRAKTLFTRPLTLQWVYGTADVAETSFFKINSQGTPLDEIEEMLIRNRKKPIAIAARAILRAGGGHKYWSSFQEAQQKEIEELAEQFHSLLFDPEVETPVKTLDLPLGGSISPVDALSLLIEFLTISAGRAQETLTIEKYPDDESGDGTISVLKNSLQILNRITGNTAGSLGLHPAVYFYNERGKYARFLFLGMTSLIAEKVRNNDNQFFKKFSVAREKVEAFLIQNKSLITLLLTNMSKGQRTSKMKDLFNFLVGEVHAGRQLTSEAAVAQLGLRGRILDVNTPQAAVQITDDTKSMLFVREAIGKALPCPLCKGLLDPTKSVSYDHIKPVRDGGTGDIANAQLVHPYCNTAEVNK